MYKNDVASALRLEASAGVCDFCFLDPPTTYVERTSTSEFRRLADGGVA